MQWIYVGSVFVPSLRPFYLLQRDLLVPEVFWLSSNKSHQFAYGILRGLRWRATALRQFTRPTLSNSIWTLLNFENKFSFVNTCWCTQLSGKLCLSRYWGGGCSKLVPRAFRHIDIWQKVLGTRLGEQEIAGRTQFSLSFLSSCSALENKYQEILSYRQVNSISSSDAVVKAIALNA